LLSWRLGATVEPALWYKGDEKVARPELTPEEIEDFRDSLCEAALDLLAEGGTEAVTMRALAKKVGCSHTTPYRYFDSKQAIITAVQQRCFEAFADYQEEQLSDDMGARDRLYALADGYVRFAADNGAAFRVMFDLEGDKEAESDALRAAIQRSWKILSDTVSLAIDDGLLAGKVKQTTFILWSSLHGLTALNQAGRLGDGIAHTMLHPMVDALIRAHEPR
jgi:AcrR family transcriptional regulator